MSIEQQNPLFDQPEPTNPSAPLISTTEHMSFPPRQYEQRVSSAYADLGGGLGDDEPSVTAVEVAEPEKVEAPALTVETEGRVSRQKAVAYATIRLADDQRLWNKLQLDMKEGHLRQSEFMDEWTREMNKRWEKRKKQDPIRFGTSK